MSFPRPFHTFRPHPWHGLDPGPDAPSIVRAYIELTPFDFVKYEVDKVTGYLHVDRPQRTSSLPPTLYGFVPRTWCGARVARLAGVERGDGDPLDICVVSERPVNRADVLVRARVIGGLRMVERGEADDKIVAVLVDDPAWAGARELADLPRPLVERLSHYFLSYKIVPGEPNPVQVDGTYAGAHAEAVVQAALDDYAEEAARPT